MRAIATLLLAALLLSGCGSAAGPDAAPEPGSYTVACVGDSLTYGTGASDPETESYPAVLSGLTGALRFQAVNFGFPGATAMLDEPGSYTRTKAYEDSLALEADIYLCMLGSNDISQFGWREEFLADYEALLRSYQALENEPLVVLLLPPHIYLGGSYDSQLQELDGKLLEIASELGLPVIDLFAFSQDMQSTSVEGLHFSAEGYALFAQEIYDRLCKILEEGTPQPNLFPVASTGPARNAARPVDFSRACAAALQRSRCITAKF